MPASIRSTSPAAPFDLTGHVPLVTGGNCGLGLGMAKGLAGAGRRASVVLERQVLGHGVCSTPWSS